MARGGIQTALAGMVSAVTASFKRAPIPTTSTTPPKNAPAYPNITYSFGNQARNRPGGDPTALWGNQDLSAFDGVFTPGQLFGPSRPVVPSEYENVRLRDYPVASNLTYTPRSYEPVTFAELRALAREVVLVRLAIETRKDQIERLDWAIKPVDEKTAPKGTAKRAADMQKFWQKPDGAQPFAGWLREALEEVLVIDAPAFEVRRTRGGDIVGLDIVDGSTLKVLIDETGRWPKPPAPAFLQVIRGRPWRLLTSDQLIYAPRNRLASGPYGFCYTSDMDVLTRRGWLPFSEVTYSDEIATRHPDTKQFEWQSPTHIVNVPYCGDMIHFHSRSMDLLVTPEHRMLVTALPIALHERTTDNNSSYMRRYKENKQRLAAGLPRLLPQLRRRSPGETIITARQLADHLNHELKIPVTSIWNGGVEVGEKKFISGRSALSISGDDYCALMGAYLAEGNIRSQGGIEINQQVASKGYPAYAALTSRILGADNLSHNGRAFIIGRRALTYHFAQFGLAHQKYVPDEIMNAPARQIRLFWDHFVLGDGSFEPRKNVSGRAKWRPATTTRITTTSKRLADQFVELAQKLGWSASVRRQPGGRAIIAKNTKESSYRESYVVSLRYSKAMSVNADTQHYTGTIHCVTVPNGIIYVRRNGKPAWSGNSPVEQTILFSNIALRRSLKQLAHFTIGNIPVGMINGGEGWTPSQLKEFWDWFNADISGNVENQTRVYPAPAGARFQSFTEAPYKDDFDEWMARIICFAFSLPPTAFTKTQNRGEQEAIKDAAHEEGTAAICGWVKRLVDDVIQVRMGQPDLEFVWAAEDDIDPKTQSEITDQKLRSMRLTLNEARGIDGLDPVAGGDEPMLYQASGAPILLKNIEALGDLAVNPPQPIVPPSPNAAAGGSSSGSKPPPATPGGGKPAARAKPKPKAPAKPAAAKPNAAASKALADVIDFLAKRAHVAADNAIETTLPLADPVLEADVQHRAWALVRKDRMRLDERDVPVASLMACGQTVVDRFRVDQETKKWLKRGGQGKFMPLVMEHSGSHVILSGLHHSQAAVNAGAAEMRVQVMSDKEQ